MDLDTLQRNRIGARCRLVTLGCKVNQYETQYVKEALEHNGFREATADEQADLCVVNTCTVTAEGDAKSRQIVRRLHRKNPHAEIVVMGCYATRDPDAVKRLPGVSSVITDKTALAEELKPYGVEWMPDGIERFDGRSRAFVKVQDGCLLKCTYCIIPQVRPSMRSRPAADIVEEVSNLVENGCREIVLTGIHLGHYGIDLSKGKPKSQWTRLWHLLEKLCALPGEFRIRLSSLEAAEVRDDLVRVMAENPKIVPHLHLCLQSGSDRILKKMKRRYRAAGFRERCRRLREALDEPAFTTDVIVGFPGETEEDFDATCQLAEEIGFSKIHIFPFSARDGTPAAELPERISSQTMKARHRRLEQLESELRQQFHRRLFGRTLDVLIEKEDPQRPGHVMGTSCRYATVSFPAYAPALIGRLAPVTVETVDGNVIIGEPAANLQQDRGAKVLQFSLPMV